MNWNYRIVWTNDGNVGIYAVYYNKKKKPISISTLPIQFLDESIEDLISELEMILLAYKRDILSENVNGKGKFEFISYDIETFQKKLDITENKESKKMDKEISWEFRVVKRVDGNYAIHCVYYDKNKKPIMMSENPEKLGSWDLKSLIKKQELIYLALKKDMLVEKINKKNEWSLKEYNLTK